METTNSPKPFEVGDTVEFDFVLTRLVGRITEDRGHIGHGGRRLLTVVAPIDTYNNITLELPESALTHSTRRVKTPVKRRIAPLRRLVRHTK